MFIAVLSPEAKEKRIQEIENELINSKR